MSRKTHVTKELREDWAIEDVVAGAMGSSSSGSLAHLISDASRSLPSGPTVQPLGAIVSQGGEDDCKCMHQFIFFSMKTGALLDQHIGTKVSMQAQRRQVQTIERGGTTRNICSLQGPQIWYILGSPDKPIGTKVCIQAQGRRVQTDHHKIVYISTGRQAWMIKGEEQSRAFSDSSDDSDQY
jgi:hypothetical protein